MIWLKSKGFLRLVIRAPVQRERTLFEFGQWFRPREANILIGTKGNLPEDQAVPGTNPRSQGSTSTQSVLALFATINKLTDPSCTFRVLFIHGR
jgi:hypothetical protein